MKGFIERECIFYFRPAGILILLYRTVKFDIRIPAPVAAYNGTTPYNWYI